jgi:hypothetical protein
MKIFATSSSPFLIVIWPDDLRLNKMTLETAQLALPCEVCEGTGGVASFMNGRSITHPCPRGCKASPAAAPRRSLTAVIDDVRCGEGGPMTATEEAKSHAKICSGLAEQHRRDPLLFAALTDAAAIINDLVKDEALLRQALEALERMVRTTGDTLEIPGVTHPSLTAARTTIAALRERLGVKA